MSILSRFFGKVEDDEDRASRLTANPPNQGAIGLQVLFDRALTLHSGEVTNSLRSYDGSMAAAQYEVDAGLSRQGKLIGLAGWGSHVVQILGFNLPMPPDAVESCVAPAHYSQELKQQAREHKSHVLLFYAGNDRSPYEQYIALAAVAGALSRFGGVVVLNESGHTSFPAQALVAEGATNMIEQLRALPLPALYCGFMKYELSEGLDQLDAAHLLIDFLAQTAGCRIWMRTHGANVLNLPDLAAWAGGHEEGEEYFNLFDHVLRYLLGSGAKISIGHTAQIGNECFLQFRDATSDERAHGGSGQDEGELLVVELIDNGPTNP